MYRDHGYTHSYVSFNSKWPVGQVKYPSSINKCFISRLLSNKLRFSATWGDKLIDYVPDKVRVVVSRFLWRLFCFLLNRGLCRLSAQNNYDQILVFKVIFTNPLTPPFQRKVVRGFVNVC